MKKTIHLLLAGTMALLCGSIGKAQIVFSNPVQTIYSQSFNGSAVTINGTAPTVANSVAGGSSTAKWICTYTNNLPAPTNGTVLGDGTIATNPGCMLLPFTPQRGAIYYLTASLAVPSPMANWVAVGFTQLATQTNNATGIFSRFTDNPPNGYGWMYVRTANADAFYGGARTGNQAGSGNLTPTAGTYTLEIILNTFGTNWGVATTTNWTVSAYVNGVIMGTNVVGGTQLGTNYIYATVNPPIAYTGLGQTAFINGGNPQSIAGIQWNNWTLSTALAPQISVEPVSASVYLHANFTNTVSAIANTNGGLLAYQWYTNNVPIGGATNAALIIKNASAANAGANYCVAVTNTFGAVTSTVVSLAVVDRPPTLAGTVTNHVTAGLSWKIAITNLATEAGWSDPDGDTVTLSAMDAASADGTNVTYDANYIYYNGTVTVEDHFGYTVTDGILTTNGTVYLEPVSTPGAVAIGNPGVDGDGHPTFSGQGIPNYTYGVESAPSLAGPWSEAGSVTANAQGSWSFTDAAQSNPGTIFYRLYYPDNPGNPPQ